MEFVQGGADRHLFEEEDTEEQEQRFSHHPPFTRAFPPSSSSSSSSSSARWAPQQMDSTDADHPNKASGSTGSGGGGGGGNSSEQQQQQRQLATAFVEKEHMFDKVVTPSDVGKLNRLVIPKQHAEKYFPLDASGNEKGLLLNFEDRSGQQWRFRYSYWNSSQSYVMTKGWSRFVKEKRLDAGDTVSFGRGVGEAARDRLFIDWRRRPVVDPPRLPVPGQTYHFSHHHDPTMMMSFGAGRSVTPWGRLVMPPPAHALPSVAVYDHHHRHLGYGYSSAPAAASNPFWYLRSAGTGSVQLGGAGSSDRAGAMPVVLDSVPLVPSSATAKRVRLFGVNLDCAAGDQEADSEGDGMAASWRPRRPAPLSSLQLRLGISEMVESPTKGKQPMSLDLGM